MEFLLEYFYPQAPQETPPIRIASTPCAFENPEQQEIWKNICEKYPFIENSFYLDSIKSAPLAHITPILQGLDIFASKFGPLITLEHTALLKESGLYAPFFARGYSKLSTTAESKNSAHLVGQFKNLLLESQQHACAIGDALALSLNCSGTRMFDALSLDFFISLIENQPISHRHSLIIGLIHLFLSNRTVTQEKALLLSRIAPVAAEFGLFWSALNQSHPNEATDGIFNLLIQYPNSFKKLLSIMTDPIVINFIASGYLSQMIEHPSVTQYTIKMFRSGGEKLTQSIWACIETHPNHNQAVLDIMFILYGAGALSLKTVSLLKRVKERDITILHQALQETSYWISEESFEALCHCERQDAVNLALQFKKEAEETFIARKDFYIQELLAETSAHSITIDEKNAVRNLTLGLLDLSEGCEKAKMFLFIKRVISNPSKEITSKISLMLEKKEELEKSAGSSIIDLPTSEILLLSIRPDCQSPSARKPHNNF